MILGPSSPFSLTAKANVPNGYSLDLCFQCKVTPTNLPPIDVVQDSIKIEAAPLDCSNSLTDKSFQNPLLIDYDSTQQTVVVASDYSKIFAHSQQQDCPLSNCILKTKDCSADLTSTHLTVGLSPFQLSAKTNISPGYVVEFCYSCEVLPTGQTTTISFQKPDITVTANPLDCTGSLLDKNMPDPPSIPFNSANGSTKVVIPDFETVFTYGQKSDC